MYFLISTNFSSSCLISSSLKLRIKSGIYSYGTLLYAISFARFSIRSS